MKPIFNSKKSGLYILVICIGIFFMTSILPAVCQSSNFQTTPAVVTYPKSSPALAANVSELSTSESDRAYCVKMGYLYRTTPSINGGQPICQFSDYSWCDANAYATGKCGQVFSSNGFYNPYGIYYPYYYNYPSEGYTPGRTISACYDRGGRVQNVHTPYGDVDMCVFPDGSMMDINGLYNRLLGDDWQYYAYSFLNAP
jgi:putative hemolysin